MSFIRRSIGRDEPQLFVDDYLIENRYNEDALSSRVPHVLHPPISRECVLAPDEAHPWGMATPSVLYDARLGRFRMYYHVLHEPPGHYFICYAESDDGLAWERPVLDLVSWGDRRRTNGLFVGADEQHGAALPHVQLNPAMDGGGQGANVQHLGTLPEEAFRGHRFLMLHGDGGHHLSTSDDGIHWQERRQTILDYHMDTFVTIVHDASLGEYVLFLRPRNIFTGPKGGNMRVVARLSSPTLWQRWDGVPATVLVPDAGDAERFYFMPAFRYGGTYFGLMRVLYENPQLCDVELTFSRDGWDWRRLPGRPKLLPVGAPGAWDSCMLSAGDRVIERGEEWWLYYNGWNGYHDVRFSERTGAIGLARWRKEGFVSVQADRNGRRSYLVTRPFAWPGGDLRLNAAAQGGYVKVAVTDLRRDPIEGFGFDDGDTFTWSATRHLVRWSGRSLDELMGRLIRLEFEFVHADLYAFVAGDGPPS